MNKSLKLIMNWCAASFLFGAWSTGVAAPAGKVVLKNPYTLEMQALQDVNNLTDVYVTVKSGTPGVLAADVAKHVQLKSFDVSGNLRWSKNEFDVALVSDAARSAGSAKFSYGDMTRFQPVQAQVQVQTGQTVSTSVIKTKVPVRLRPDLTVTEIRAKDTVHVGEVINLAATVRELNGDVGALARISLVNGTEQLDLAAGVTVTPNGNAGVVFSTLFTQPGTYQLTVRVDASNPGDYDSRNNQKDFTVTVVDGTTAVPYQMSYWHVQQDYYYNWGSWYDSGTYRQNGEYQGAYGYLDLVGQDVVYPLKATMNLRVDGKPELLMNKSVSGVNPDYSWAHGCYNGYSAFRDLGDGVYFYAGGGNYCDYYRWNYAQFAQYANDYVYFSEYHSYYWGHSSYSGTVKNGTFIRATQSVQSNFVVEGADGKAYGGELEIPVLQTYPFNDSWNYSWYDYYSNGWNRGVQINGYTSGITQ